MTTMDRRFFTEDERWDLYYKANGKCQICHMGLHGVFHADHVVPFSRGGETSLENGQVLCGECNRMKSDRYSSLKELDLPLREWQADAFDVYMRRRAEDAVNVLINATPGAGKTFFALYVAYTLFNSGAIDRIIVIVPTDELRRQWQIEASTYFGIELASVFDSDDSFASDYHGMVTTYGTIAARHGRRKAVGNLIKGKRTLAIVDEIHHVAESYRWGVAMEDALESCVSRLLITGTPFRSDRNRIPFITYIPDGDGLICKADFSYGYGEALRDGVVRPVYIQTFDGDARWFDEDGSLVEVSFSAELSSKQAGQRLRMAVNAKGDWLKNVLIDANRKLMEMRTEDPRAGGLVFAQGIPHAWAIAGILNELGVTPVVVASKLENGDPDPEASAKIDAFRNSTSPWIIAVKMVSEGIDIKRLRVGVWATNVQTEMFFRQGLGRILRMDKDGVEGQDATLYIPKIEPLTTYAESVKKEKHHVIDDLDAIEELLEELKKRYPEDAEDTSRSSIQFVSNNGFKDAVIADEYVLTAAEISTARGVVIDMGEQPTDKLVIYTAKLTRKLDKVSHHTVTNGNNGTTKRQAKPLEKQKDDYREVVRKLLRPIVEATNGVLSYESINRLLNQSQGVIGIKACELEQLKKRIEILIAWRKACDNGTWREFTPKGYLRQFPG